VSEAGVSQSFFVVRPCGERPHHEHEHHFCSSMQSSSTSGMRPILSQRLVSSATQTRM
jgi:hypothetical protein